MTASRASIFFVLASVLGSSLAYTPKDVSLELVMVQSLYGTHEYWHPIDNHMLKGSLQSIGSAIEAQFPSSRLSVVGFKDYAQDHAGCYRHYTGLDEAGAWAKASASLLEDKTYANTDSDSPKHDSSLSAAMLAATRAESKFTTGPMDKTSKPMVRVVAVVSDMLPVLGGTSYKGSPAFKGDGLDTCANDAPTLAEAAAILKKLNMFMVVFTSEENKAFWTAALPALGPNVILETNNHGIYKVDPTAVTKSLGEVLTKMSGSSTSTPKPGSTTHVPSPSTKPASSTGASSSTNGSSDSTTTGTGTTTSGAFTATASIAAVAAAITLLH